MQWSVQSWGAGRMKNVELKLHRWLSCRPQIFTYLPYLHILKIGFHGQHGIGATCIPNFSKKYFWYQENFFKCATIGLATLVMSQDSWEILIRIPKFPEIFRDYICHVRPLNMPLEWHPNYILISKKLWFKSVLRQVIMSHICRRMILNIYHPWGQPCIGHFHSSSKGATMDRSFLFFLQGRPFYFFLQKLGTLKS
jgi:hypothetical protein